MSIVTYRIHEIPSTFNGNLAGFLTAVFEIEVPDSTIASRWRNVQLTGRQLLDLVGINRGPNLRMDGFKAVRFAAADAATTDPRFDASFDHTLADLDTKLCVLGTRCWVEFGPDSKPAIYVLRYDGAPRAGGPSSGPQTWADGHAAPPVPLVPCRWVLENSASASVRDYAEYAAGYSFPAGTYVGAYVVGQTTEQFFKRRSTGPAPAPTAGGDATYWELVSSTDVPRTGVSQQDFDALVDRVAMLETSGVPGGSSGGVYQLEFTATTDGDQIIPLPVATAKVLQVVATEPVGDFVDTRTISPRFCTVVNEDAATGQNNELHITRYARVRSGDVLVVEALAVTADGYADTYPDTY